MNITRLQLANMRALEQAELDFMPGMNLLVGVNGVGKTTVLDSLRICFSKILPNITASKSRPFSIADEDIRIDAPAATVQLSFNLAGKDFEFLMHKQRETVIAHKAGVVRQQTLGTPDKETFTPSLSVLDDSIRSSERQILCVFFSIRRSLPSDTTPSSFTAFGGQAGAFTDALTSRGLRLAEMALWMRAQEALSNEEPRAQKHLAALRRAANRFLPECRNLRVENNAKPRLLIDKKSKTLDVRQLSDGERGLLALVLDLARRLSQANPGLTDPVSSGDAIVLIDELDLHLHPKWQRTIVERLTKTFPKCQFIATTHSPQIVAAVEPDQILLLTDIGITRPDRSLGMDSNWILRHLMEADDRPAGSAEVIRQVEALIKKGAFKKARSAIAKARKNGLDLPEWSIFDARMGRLEALAK
jgi:predicted ATP-binding protein involved in virulence